MSKWERTNLPCPCKKSSDSYALDKDGNGFCFRGDCNKFFKNNKEIKENLTENTNTQNPDDDVKFSYYAHRGISENTMRHYNVQTKFINSEPVECGFIFPNKAVQVKKLDRNLQVRYRTEGEYGAAGLYGKDKFDPGSKESITICEGLHDALSVYEITNGQTAAVAIKSASSAKSDCTKDWEYINSFKRIILCLDNDEPGQKALKDIVPMFDFNKVYQVKLTKRKDVNEYLENNEAVDFLRAWKNARRFAPDNIISSFKEIEKSLEESLEDRIGSYPFKGIDTSLYGLHQGEVVVIKADEGVGKTEFFRALEHHLLSTTNHPIGIIHLEEDNATTVKAIAGYELALPAVLPDCGLSKEDVLAAYKKAVKDDEGRVHIYSSFDVEDEDSFLSNIRFLVSAAGCKFIFLDHITWLATGMDNEDERKKLDRISQKLKLLAKELKFCLIMISHVNDDGKTRGSRNISKVANSIIMLNRDKTSLDPIVRNTTEFTIEKARLGGRTGPGGKAVFNSVSGKLEELTDKVYANE